MRVLIRYTVHPDHIDRSVDLLREVYADLERSQPPGLRYETFQLNGTGEFLAMIESDGGPGDADHHRLESFQRYRAALNDICTQLPTVTHLEPVGTYRSR
jgi:quinol monooxygenase YgiN